LRFRTLTVAVIAVLACLAYEHRTELTQLTILHNPSAALADFSKPATRFSLRTLPEPPIRRRVTILKLHAVDADGQPADGLTVEVDANARDGEERKTSHATLHAKGHGNYVGEITFEEVGSWDVDVTATKDDNSVRQRLEIQVQNVTERTFGDDTDES
jgi:nitrogen fixation protein FixH